MSQLDSIWEQSTTFQSYKHQVPKKSEVKDLWTGHLCTLESGIKVPPWINVAPGKFDKKNNRSPIYTLYLYY